jgi:hypothetical protein
MRKPIIFELKKEHKIENIKDKNYLNKIYYHNYKGNEENKNVQRN